MTRKSGKTLDMLRSLLAERQQYEQWLAALANKRADTADQVYERVHADYQSRLEGVLSRLSAHTDELQSTMADLTSRVSDLTKRDETRREERQEAELRAAVGEFTPAKWEEIRVAAESELAAIAEERTGLDGQLAELAGIMSLVQGRTPPLPEAVSAAVRDRVEGEQLSIEQPVSGEITTVEPAAIESATTESSDEPAASSGYRPPLDPLAEVGEGSSIPFPDWEAPLQSVSKAASEAASKSIPEITRPEQQKTLKCPECGTMNFPTEWYCEQCGGELAAL